MDANVWRKAKRSMNNGNCVEVKAVCPVVMVRDSADPAGPVVSFTGDAWYVFIQGVATTA